MTTNGPDYEDRGLLKWMGFYLSDHTEKIEDESRERLHDVLAKPQMEVEEIQTVLRHAAIKRLPVAIQKEERDVNGKYPADTIGVIQGQDSLGIYIGYEKIDYDEIRHIEVTPQTKWSTL
ncbi:hypothetical protein [Enterococcus gilvus]|uniref:hypothetical protein n=1 Tax=Enterococcus gilvus TaxID=160453 RepID=UPI003ED9217B